MSWSQPRPAVLLYPSSGGGPVPYVGSGYSTIVVRQSPIAASGVGPWAWAGLSPHLRMFGNWEESLAGQLGLPPTTWSSLVVPADPPHLVGTIDEYISSVDSSPARSADPWTFTVGGAAATSAPNSVLTRTSIPYRRSESSPSGWQCEVVQADGGSTSTGVLGTIKTIVQAHPHVTEVPEELGGGWLMVLVQTIVLDCLAPPGTDITNTVTSVIAYHSDVAIDAVHAKRIPLAGLDLRALGPTHERFWRSSSAVPGDLLGNVRFWTVGALGPGAGVEVTSLPYDLTDPAAIRCRVRNLLSLYVRLAESEAAADQGITWMARGSAVSKGRELSTPDGLVNAEFGRDFVIRLADDLIWKPAGTIWGLSSSPSAPASYGLGLYGTSAPLSLGVNRADPDPVQLPDGSWRVNAGSATLARSESWMQYVEGALGDGNSFGLPVDTDWGVDIWRWEAGLVDVIDIGASKAVPPLAEDHVPPSWEARRWTAFSWRP